MAGHGLAHQTETLRNFFMSERQIDDLALLGGLCVFGKVQNELHQTPLRVIQGNPLDQGAELLQAAGKKLVEGQRHLRIGLDHAHVFFAGQDPDRAIGQGL